MKSNKSSVVAYILLYFNLKSVLGDDLIHAFLYMQRFFSAQPQCSLTFS